MNTRSVIITILSNIIYVFIGALIFWGSHHLFLMLGEVGLHVVSGILIIIGQPILLFAVYKWVSHQKKRLLPLMALLMILGIWISGPLYLYALNPDLTLASALEDILKFPISTFIISTYTLALGALQISTIMLLIIGINGLKKNKDIQEGT